MDYDITIIGGGIVGLSTALAFTTNNPGIRLLLLEKEREWAAHQTGRNSGVIHSGIYYKPGSLKARFAREGNAEMAAFCLEHGIPHEICGKTIVATSESELPLLDRLYERGRENALEVSRMTAEDLGEREPHVRGLAALLVPSTGIVNYTAVARKYAELAGRRGGDLRLGAPVRRIAGSEGGVLVETDVGAFQARLLVNCAGLQCDRIARMAGLKELPGRIVPFRGEYYTLKPERRHLVKHLIYPVPDPRFPFLGVHFTRMIDGSIHAGPNAVLSLKREGYSNTDVSLSDAMDALSFSGFLRLAARNWRPGLAEIVRSFSKEAFVRSLQTLIPEVRIDDVVPSEAGVRAQMLMPDGRLADDFLIVEGPNSLHVLNAPSPAATASLPIGRHLAKMAAERLGRSA